MASNTFTKHGNEVFTWGKRDKGSTLTEVIVLTMKQSTFFRLDSSKQKKEKNTSTSSLQGLIFSCFSFFSDVFFCFFCLNRSLHALKKPIKTQGGPGVVFTHSHHHMGHVVKAKERSEVKGKSGGSIVPLSPSQARESAHVCCILVVPGR